jgi:hypothetical protein
MLALHDMTRRSIAIAFTNAAGSGWLHCPA